MQDRQSFFGIYFRQTYMNIIVLGCSINFVFQTTKILLMLLLKNNFVFGVRNLFHLRSISKYNFGVIRFNLPDLGEKIKQGTIKKIYVKQGDLVEQFQKLADVASDKQFTEITAANTGVIRKIHYKQEDVCQVGDLFLQIYVKDDAEQASQVPSQSINKTPETVNNVKQSKKTQKNKINTEILASPYVRGLIKQHGLNINTIQGTGEGGRILQKDVQNVVNNKSQSKEVKQKAEEKVQIKQQKQQKPEPITFIKQSPVSSKLSNVSTISMSPYQKGMQKSMTESNTIPHLYLHEQFDITEVQRMRKSLKQSNKKVTVMGILIKTFSLALKQYPKMNSLYQPEVNPFQYNIYPNHNISIAIDSPNGLVVPHIKNVNNINLLQIQSQLQRLRNLAKQAKLTSKELQGGTVCLSNIGTIGGTHACPLILPPQVCIVAIGKLQSLPKYRGSEIVQRKIITVSYGCDHRVIDGATVARFSNCWKQLIQNPYISIAQMI